MARNSILLGVCLTVGLVAAACQGSGGSSESSGPTRIPQATRAQLSAAGLGRLPVAPASRRIDLTAPPFSNSTHVTNPLFPIGRLRSAVLAGEVDAKPFKTETTLLPTTRLIEWPEGGQVETLVSQYVAYLGGRLEEVALDYYAQADDGSVWYFGEDVFNYKGGVIADTEGTWIAGEENPPAMIMPADPQVGDVYRSENVPGLVFEEVTVRAVDKIVNGPSGPVTGAMIGEELHQDGTREAKTFAPGYGEFFTGAGGDVEAIALAVPADALSRSVPAELQTLSASADAIFNRVQSGSWSAASRAFRSASRAWKSYSTARVPPRLDSRMKRALDDVGRVVAARDRASAATAAIAVAQAGLDLQLRYRPPAEVDRARFGLWARRLLVDAAADDVAGATGDVATLEWIRDRFAHTLGKVERTRIDTELGELRTSMIDGDLRGAAETATALAGTRGAGEPSG